MRLLYIFIIFNIFIFSEDLFSKELSEREKFDNLSKEISNWGRWGANDQLGTLNNISNSNIIDAKKLVIEGKTISLSRNMSKDIDEMESMLNDYLQFAKTQTQENTSTINLSDLFKEIQNDLKTENLIIVNFF